MHWKKQFSSPGSFLEITTVIEFSFIEKRQLSVGLFSRAISVREKAILQRQTISRVISAQRKSNSPFREKTILQRRTISRAIFVREKAILQCWTISPCDIRSEEKASAKK